MPAVEKKFRAGEKIYVISRSELFGRDKHFGKIVTGNISMRLWEGIGRVTDPWADLKKEPHVLVELYGDRVWLPVADVFAEGTPMPQRTSGSASPDFSMILDSANLPLEHGNDWRADHQGFRLWIGHPSGSRVGKYEAEVTKAGRAIYLRSTSLSGIKKQILKTIREF